MKQQLFESNHEGDWQVFEVQLNALEKKRKKPDTDVSAFANHYRKICYDLTLAQSRQYSPYLIDRLNQLTLRGHQQLYQHRSNLLHSILRFIVAVYPQQVRKEIKLVLFAGLLLYGPALVTGLLTYFNPDLVFSLHSEGQVAEFTKMYNPDKNAESAEARTAADDLIMFGFYIRNNIGIGFQTFASGILLGIGSLFFLIFNGLAMGTVAGFLTSMGYHTPFYSFVITHGAFELTAIVISGAAGMKLGFSLLAPGQFSRSQALRTAGKDSILLVYGVILFLLIAAFLEAFWSSSSVITPAIKYTVGGSAWVLVLAYFCLGGRNGS